MTRYIKLSAVAAAAMLAAPAFAATDVSANAEFDTGFFNQSRGLSVPSGRIETNVSGKATNGDFFVAGRGTVLISQTGTAGVDDAWVQVGNSVVDIKMNRFEAADLWPTPGDVFRVGAYGGADATADTVGIYTLNTLRGRATYGDTRFHAAITANVAPGVSVEVGIVEKKDVKSGLAVPSAGIDPITGLVAVIPGTPASAGSKGIRPSVAFAAGPVSARLGFETGKTSDTTAAGKDAKFTGFGGWVSAGVADGITLRGQVASGKTQYATGDLKRTSFLFGVDAFGANVSAEIAKNTVGGVDTKYTGLFAAYAIPLFDIKGATFSPALGYLKSKVGSVSNPNDSRIGFRIHYDF